MSQILTALLDSQSDTDLGDLGYATTQCDSTQVDSDPGSPLKFPTDIDNIDVCSTDEDVDTTASEGPEELPHGPQALPIQAIETCLRHRVGLEAKQNLHPPAPRIFNRQAEALCCLEALVSSGRYKSQQLGLFSREFNTTGCRSFLVDTHAGFAVTASPQRSFQKSRASLGPRHLYEVLLENKPCWLYFDLEFSRVENPDLDPQAVASAFLELLNKFCDMKFGHAIDPATFYDLDSTNAEKFSKHIIIKRLQSYGSACNTLAFPSNAQAGYFVKLFMDWVRQQREARMRKVWNCIASFFSATQISQNLRGISPPRPATLQLSCCLPLQSQRRERNSNLELRSNIVQLLHNWELLVLGRSWKSA